MNRNLVVCSAGALLLALLVTGCAQRPMMGDPFAGGGMNRPSPGETMSRTSQLPNARDTQNDYRRELLRSQLKQSQLDLQAATTFEEQQSVQERMKIIRDQLRRLGERG